MASAGAGRSRRWLARSHTWRTCLLAGLAASVAGCVGMPNSGSPGTFSATPQDTSQDSDFIGAVPAGPQPNWSPADIVTGFLNATVSYPAYSAIAEEYLASSVPRNWAPNWSVTVVDQVIVSPEATFSDGGRRAVVDVTGAVQASFNGTGQYVGAQQGLHGTQTANQQFTLVKAGQAVADHEPAEVPDADRARFRPGLQAAGPVLLRLDRAGARARRGVRADRDLVGVAGDQPGQGAAEQPAAEMAAGHGNPTPPAVTAFPLHSTAKNIDVTVDGTTATVNLTGAAASASPADREQMATQLVWTLTGQPGSPPDIQAVQLEFNGKPWTPSSPPCLGGGAQSPALKQAMYDCKNPYPVATSSAFYYVANGQAWSRCASEAQVTTGSVGVVVPVFDRTGVATLNQSCKNSVQASSQAVPPPQAHAPPPLSMVAVSPDGKYLAGVSPGGNTVTVWAAGAAKPSSTLSLPGVTAISWDRRDYLWVAQGDDTTMVVQTNDSSNHAAITNGLPARQDPRPEHRPGRSPGRRHRAGRARVRPSSSRRSTAASWAPASRATRSTARPSGDRAARAERHQSDRADLVRRR